MADNVSTSSLINPKPQSLKTLAETGARVLGELAGSLASVMRILADRGAGATMIPRVTGQRLVVVGSGPSLNASLDVIANGAPDGCDLMTVNDFYRTDIFRMLKPAYHVIADSAYWTENSFEELAAPLLEALRCEDWNSTLFVPSRARGSTFFRELQQTGRPYVVYRMTPIKGLPRLESLLFWQRLGMPRAQNVLVAALSIGLWLGYRQLCLIGADHAWHKELDVTSENILVVRQVHSYDSEVVERPFLKPESIGRYRMTGEVRPSDVFSMREIFTAWAAVHESYERVARIARGGRASIWNCSAASAIDAFERKDLAQFLSESLSR